MQNEQYSTEEIEITPEQLSLLPEGSYVPVDLRDREDYDHGFIPGCVLTPPDVLYAAAADEKAEPSANPALSGGKKLVLYCRYGQVSKDLALRLRERGYDAVSLAGGYGAFALYSIRKEAENDRVREKVERSIQKKFHGSLLNPFVRGIMKYDMIQEGDRIAVCISGGKDSMCMAKLFQELQIHGQFHFDLKFLVMDPGYSEANRKIIESNAKLLGIPVTIFETDIFEAVYNIPTSPCYLCARMRRGYLYRKAGELGCNKIALGHHFDDVIETALMGMLSSGQFNAMMPKLHSSNYEGMELIRPLYFVREDDIRHWRDYNGLHFIQCACRFTDTCSSCDFTAGFEKASGSDQAAPPSGSRRVLTKQLIAQLKPVIPEIETNIFHATENVSLDQVLGYKKGGVRHSFLDEY